MSNEIPFTAVIEPGMPVRKIGACAVTEIKSNAASPQWDTPAETTQCGVLETDNHAIAQPLGSGVRQVMVATTVRYGLTPRLEVRWGPPGHMIQSGGGNPRLTGTTDQWLGACYRFYSQGRWMPDLALDYAIKIPTANPAKGFGSGYVDHLVTFVASRDFGQNHIDFNTVGTIAGGAQRYDGAPQFGLAFTRSAGSRLLLTIEAYGGPEPATSDRYGAVLTGGAWSIRPWLALNGGYSRAYTAGAPHEQSLFGFIYTLRPGFAPRLSRLAHEFGR